MKVMRLLAPRVTDPVLVYIFTMRWHRVMGDSQCTSVVMKVKSKLIPDMKSV